jgi:hypothetical protein
VVAIRRLAAVRPGGLLREHDFACFWTAGAVSFAGSAVTLGAPLALAIIWCSPVRKLRRSPAPVWAEAEA